MTKTLRPTDLKQFTGSEHWYRHPLNRAILYTDGAQYVADAGEAHWLLDTIVLAQRYEPRVAATPFQVWTLRVQVDGRATLTCEDGDGCAPMTQVIPWTDFPLETLTLYYTNNVIYLPSEH